MKRIAIALVLSLLLVATLSGVALAKAEKVTLNQIGSDNGGGFVVFNDTSGPDNVQIEMSLKGALANTDYDVIVHIGAPDTYVATITTNTQGNANFHYSASVAPGDQLVGLGLKRAGVWQFGTGLLTHTLK
jgi:uncharacterized membrane protein